MPEDQQIGGAYVRVGARTDELEQMLGRSETLTKNSLKTMGDMASEFARNFSNALGLAIPGAGLAGAAGALGAGASSLGGSQAGLVSGAGMVGANAQAMQSIATSMHSAFHEKMAISQADANSILETGLRSGAINPDGSNAESFFRLVRNMSMVGNVSATQAAQDAASSFGGGAELGKYGVFTPGGPMMNQFGLLMARMKAMEPIAESVANLPTERAARAAKDISSGVSSIGMGALELALPSQRPGMNNLDRDADGNVFGAGSHLRINSDFEPHKDVSPGPHFDPLNSLNMHLKDLALQFKMWIHENRTQNQGT